MLAAPFLVWLIKLAVYSLIFHAFYPITYVRWLVYAGVVVSFCLYLAIAVISGVICGPKGGSDRLAYLAGIAGQECDNPAGLIQISSIASGVVNLASDVYLLILPLPTIIKLKLPLKKRLGVMFIFMAGVAYVSSLGCNINENG